MTDKPLIENEASKEEFEEALKAAQQAAKVEPTDAAPEASTAPVKALDTLQANEFHVEIDGEVAEGVFRIEGLVTFKLEIKPAQTKKVQEPITVAKMVQRDPDMPFNKWLRETIEAGDDIVHPTRTLDIVAVDDGTETRRWSLSKAWISEISYSDFDTASGEMVEERIMIQYETIEESWPWKNA